MSARLVFEKTARAGIFVARVGERTALVQAHVCNGRGVYGFDEEAPNPYVEQALARRSDRQVAKLIASASELP